METVFGGFYLNTQPPDGGGASLRMKPGAHIHVFFLSTPGYEDDMEKVSSIFTVSSFPLPAATSITLSWEPHLLSPLPDRFPGLASPFSAPEMSVGEGCRHQRAESVYQFLDPSPSSLQV